MRLFFILLSLIITGELLHAQEALPNCTSPKIINVPFVSDNDKIDQIYYELADEYTYWYQIIPKIDCILEYNMTIIEESDDYEFLIYQSLSNRFCNDLVANEIKPISYTKSGSLTLKKGEAYFFSVIYLNGNGCGHNLSLKIGEKRLNLKAIQNECVEQVMEELTMELVGTALHVEPEGELALVVIDTIVYSGSKIELIAPKINNTVDIKPELEKKEVPFKLENIVKGIVINSKTNENIEAIVIVNVSKEAPKQQLYSSIDSGFVLKSFIDKEIVVSVKKLGYQLFYDTLNVESGSFKIELTPVAVGEKIVMKKVYFHPNTHVLKEESKPELNKLLEFMLENKDYSFEIQGHTNGNKSIKKTKRYTHLGEEWNFKGTSKKLSKLRAEKIKSFLIKNGVSENQLQTEGYGGDKMIVVKPKNMTQAMKNIRVEVIVLQ